MLMQIEMDMTELDPPTGTVRLDGQKKQDFVGWLGLIHALDELIRGPAKK